MTTVTLMHAPKVNKGSHLHFEASQEKYITVFPRSNATATNFILLLKLAATIRGRRLLEDGDYSRMATKIITAYMII